MAMAIMFASIVGANAALGSYEWVYCGTFSGDDSGYWSMEVYLQTYIEGYTVSTVLIVYNE